MNMIQTTSLKKNYGKSRGIVDLNLTVSQGEIFGFIGPNGAGKSTTIRLLLGLISPTAGQATVFGLDVQKDKKEILSRIGYMPSEAMFYNGMRVSEMLSFSASLRKKDCKAEAARLCEQFQLDTKKRVEELSLGNRKKVAIVCAFMHQPDLYILDEPTSGLDPLMQREFFSLIHQRHQQGATVFLSSHVLSEIQHHCQRAAIVREGRLIACDKVENLANTNTRKVVLHGVTDAPALSGIRDVSASGNSVSFLYHGEMPMLLKELYPLPITDMTITEPELDEIFLHYYEKGGK